MKIKIHACTLHTCFKLESSCTVYICIYIRIYIYIYIYIFFFFFLRLERKKYHSHREKARSCPEKFLTMIIDGMDQSKTNIPNTKLISKSTSSLWRLRTHITGVILHTKAPCGKLTYCFIDFIQYPHDSNLTLTVMINVLVDFSTQYRLPEVLYIQMDNTCRENKNKFVLTFIHK